MSRPTRAALLRQAAAMLRKAGVPHPNRDARILMRWAGDLTATALSLGEETPPGVDELDRFSDAIARRAARTPVSHITGMREFWGRAFRVTSDVLDPRPETECLIAEALHRGPFQRVLDLGTGSGCILLTLLAEWPGATGLGTDTSEGALNVARGNAKVHGIDRAAFAHHDWFNGVSGTFDMIVSNPPYIAIDEMTSLAPEVREHEPRSALTPGGDGLDAYRAIAAGIGKRLASGGLILVEIGPKQSEAVSSIFAGAGLIVRAVIPDLDQRARVIAATG